MLHQIFAPQKATAPRKFGTQELTSFLPGSRFEDHVFSSLIANKEMLGISRVFKCTNARMDGYVETTAGEFILIEVKESLGWGPFNSACFELLAGRNLLGLSSTKAIIIFRSFYKEWESVKAHDAWSQFYVHANEIRPHLHLEALRLINGQFQCAPTYRFTT